MFTVLLFAVCLSGGVSQMLKWLWDGDLLLVFTLVSCLFPCGTKTGCCKWNWSLRFLNHRSEYFQIVQGCLSFATPNSWMKVTFRFANKLSLHPRLHHLLQIPSHTWTLTCTKMPFFCNCKLKGNDHRIRKTSCGNTWDGIVRECWWCFLPLLVLGTCCFMKAVC